MSRDDYIYINPNNYEVWVCTASKVKGRMYKQKVRLIQKCKTLKQALEVADRQDAEYGVSLHLWAK